MLDKRVKQKSIRWEIFVSMRDTADDKNVLISVRSSVHKMQAEGAEGQRLRRWGVGTADPGFKVG